MACAVWFCRLSPNACTAPITVPVPDERRWYQRARKARRRSAKRCVEPVRPHGLLAALPRTTPAAPAVTGLRAERRPMRFR